MISIVKIEIIFIKQNIIAIQAKKSKYFISCFVSIFKIICFTHKTPTTHTNVAIKNAIFLLVNISPISGIYDATYPPPI